MSAHRTTSGDFTLLESFLSRDICQRGMKPLKEGVEIALYLNDKGPVTVGKSGEKPQLTLSPPQSPDITTWIPSNALHKLDALQTEELGEMGIALVKLMLEKDPSLRIRVQVHLGIIDLIRKGYLAVLPLGGGTLMKYLASLGLTGLGKIKKVIARLRKEPQ